jgi:hypothetical protein
MELKVGLENEYINETRFLFKANVVPKVRFQIGEFTLVDELDLGVFAHERGTEAEVDVVNLFPGIPYHPMKLEVENHTTGAPIEAELVEVAHGSRYRIKIKIPPGPSQAGFVQGCVLIHSDHPDLFLKKLYVTGWRSFGSELLR